MAKENNILKEVETRINSKEDIPLVDYIKYLQNYAVLQSSFLTISILNSLIRKLFNNEGIDLETDDPFRHVYKKKFNKVS